MGDWPQCAVGSVVISEMAWIVYMQILSERMLYNVENMAFP